MKGSTPSLDVRLTRSQSGNILDIDFVGGVADVGNGSVPAVMPAPAVPIGAPITPSTAIVASGRKLKILEHRVHKVEMRTKESGESEEELVVSNLRPFTLKVGVHDANDVPILDCSLPLRATLLYENGATVKQTSLSEPLLVGETDVVALQGAATFKLRITSLSSHRDKQRFRIQVAPQDANVLKIEPSLNVVVFTRVGRCPESPYDAVNDAQASFNHVPLPQTDPMKSVTKLGRSMPAPPAPPPATTTEVNNNAALEAATRKCRDTLEAHAHQIQQLQDLQADLLNELQAVSTLAERVVRAKTAAA